MSLRHLLGVLTVFTLVRATRPSLRKKKKNLLSLRKHSQNWYLSQVLAIATPEVLSELLYM